MTKNVNVIESAKVVLAGVRADVRTANKEFNSLSSVLRVMTRADMLKAGYKAAFLAVGVTDPKALTPKALTEMCAPEQFVAVTNKRTGKEEQVMAVQGWKTSDDGKTKVPVWRKITSWTPTKVLTLMAQSVALKAAK